MTAQMAEVGMKAKAVRAVRTARTQKEPLETLEPLADGAGGAQVYAHVRARFAAHAAACGV